MLHWYPLHRKELHGSVDRVLVENVERRERPDNLEPLDLLEDEDALETMDPKETRYEAHHKTLWVSYVCGKLPD